MPANPEEQWRDDCLRGILSYPPGTQRRLVMDAMRFELVHQLGQYFRYVDSTVHRIRQFATRKSELPAQDAVSGRDLHKNVVDTNLNKTKNDTIDLTGNAGLSTATITSDNSDEPLPPSESELQAHKHNMKQIRDCLPQLVSAVLKAPVPFDPNLVDPVHRLRELIISRCQQDPSWGIELCWLLEAEVGRSWKRLFEHRPQMRGRLLIVLPAERAAVLTQIDPKKREAFDLLQDAERVTAYGYPADHEIWHEQVNGPRPHHWNEPQSETRLPSSLSLLRCSHFGDTMQFIDRMTQISLDLTRVPAIHRRAYLEESLYEMNRRLRRRMVTRGEISLDIDDNLGPFEWPGMSELTLDMLKYSIHLPLVPNEGVWPSGSMENESDDGRGCVVQVLNIVVPESRLLASRERCPYLVRLEVADTGLEGSDARLYAAGAPRLGLTVEEALCTKAASNAGEGSTIQNPRHLPVELIHPETKDGPPRGPSNATSSENFPRGGWQIETDGVDFMDSNPYDAYRSHEYEQLHQHMQDSQQGPYSSIPGPIEHRPTVSTGEDLLNRVFGQPWKEVCDEVRRTSPYGHVKGWRLASFILKAGEDIRREALVMQMISKFKDWFDAELPEEHRPFLRPYTIMCVGGDAGLLECLTDAKSVDEVKKTCDGFVSLRDFFERAYGAWPNSRTSFEQAQDNFLRSLVGYSLVCYILQIKDRHNANILLDREGHIMHIDFGFVLGDTPRMGKVPIFNERAPFKLSNEFWGVLGGWNYRRGGLGVKFCKMFDKAFTCASAHAEELASLVEGIMLTLHDNPAAAKLSAREVRSRLRMRGPPGSQAQQSFIRDLIDTALNNWGTSTYDWLQKNMNGYQ